MIVSFFFFFKQKTAYEMRISAGVQTCALPISRITEVSGHHFKTEGKVLGAPGWLAIYGREAQGDDTNLVAVSDGEKVKTDDVQAKGLATKPPAHFTEATLLSAMEGAGKLVDDDALREAKIGRAHV